MAGRRKNVFQVVIESRPNGDEHELPCNGPHCLCGNLLSIGEGLVSRGRPIYSIPDS